MDLPEKYKADSPGYEAMRKITSNQFKEVVDLFNSGMAIKEIAAKYNANRVTVHRVLKKMGVDVSKKVQYERMRKIKADQHPNIARLYYQMDVSISDIAALYNVTYAVIWQLVCKLRPTSRSRTA